ncbi:MAG: hypothetical protein DRO99_05305 [Candidatus Aenigmatarchaeota archaeon]|nr:MAG: hypothetical protein DRO99_05305 [Candidatus Aenigmarchaeota archaeon]
MEFVSGNVIEIDREISELDRFALDFIKVIREHVDYVVVSGYVSIIMGRARASEDIDVIIPITGREKIDSLFESMKGKFYCFNSNSAHELYDNLKSGIPARFARKGAVIPNAEVKFARTLADNTSLKKAITARFGGEELKISPLEMQVAFKEKVLRSPKDIEDAMHIRNVAKGHIDEERIREYKVMLDGIYGRKQR